jgi:hypothetical protein
MNASATVNNLSDTSITSGPEPNRSPATVALLALVLLSWILPFKASADYPDTPAQIRIYLQALITSAKSASSEKSPEKSSLFAEVEPALLKVLADLAPEFTWIEDQQRSGYEIQVLSGDYLQSRPDVTHTGKITTDKHVIHIRVKAVPNANFQILGYGVELAQARPTFKPDRVKFTSFFSEPDPATGTAGIVVNLEFQDRDVREKQLRIGETAYRLTVLGFSYSALKRDGTGPVARIHGVTEEGGMTELELGKLYDIPIRVP